MIDNIPPPPPKLKRTPRGVDTNNAIPNNNSIIYKFSKRDIDKNGMEIFKFIGYDVITNKEINIWLFVIIGPISLLISIFLNYYFYKKIKNLKRYLSKVLIIIKLIIKIFYLNSLHIQQFIYKR